MPTIYIPDFSLTPKKKTNKYHNKKVRIDGILFDSLFEASRYKQLLLEKRVGNIKSFGVHPSFLLPGGVRYEADFIITDNCGKTWVEDTKGVETKDFKIKKKLWPVQYSGIELRLIKE